jgi:hypothetical protein
VFAPALLALSIALPACSPRTGSEERGADPARSAEVPVSASQDAWTPHPSWVAAYDPQTAASGYNMILMRRRLPVLMDMNGRALHSWPMVRATGRARLLPDCSLLFIANDGTVREVSWEGEETWQYRLDGEDFPHHDLIPLANGNRLVLAHDVENRIDYLVEVGPNGEVVWTWHALDHLGPFLERAGDERLDRQGNATHINSVFELVPNSRHAAGDERFRPGNILLSARNLNTLFIIDRDTGAVVWSYDTRLDHQHEALMIPDDRPGGGNIIFFNNGLKDLYEYRRSFVTEIDPANLTVAWEYQSPTFFSSTGGTQQVLPNGNILVTSSRGGRVFELTRGKKIVWQWTPLYSPMRVERYPYDHCPQLAALPRPEESRVRNRNPTRYVDADLYEFVLAHETQKTEIAGKSVRVLRETSICRRLVLPERPEIGVGYGTKPRKEAPEGRQLDLELEVRLTLLKESPEVKVIFADSAQPELNPEGFLHGERIELGGLDFQRVEVCLEARSGDGEPPPPAFFWTAPTIRARKAHEIEQTPTAEDEKALQEKHLRALGYVD